MFSICLVLFVVVPCNVFKINEEKAGFIGGPGIADEFVDIFYIFVTIIVI